MTLSVLLLATLAVSCLAADIKLVDNSEKLTKEALVQKLREKFLKEKYAVVGVPKPRAGEIGCPLCVDFFSDYMGDILEVILEGGVVGGCAELCSVVMESIGAPQIALVVCDFLCLIGGLEEFSKLLQNADLDPVYVCAELDICPKNTCQTNCTSITAIDPQPKSGPQRTKFSVNVHMKVDNNVGSGITVAAIDCPLCPNHQYEGFKLNEGWPAGTKPIINMPLVDSGYDEWLWPPATYSFEIASCANGCSDKHGVIFDKKISSFTITK